MKPRPLAWIFVVPLLSGCAEPFTHAGTWHAVGVNQANLDAQVVNRADTVAGRGLSGSDAVLDAAAVNRLYDDKAKALRVEATSSVGGQ